MTRADAAAIALLRRALSGSTSAAGTIVIEDAIAVEAAVGAGVRVLHVFEREGSPPDSTVAAPTPLIRIEASVYDQLFATTRRPRLVALASRPPRVNRRRLADRPGDLVVLDGVTGPGNIGSIVRSAAAFGAAGVCLLDAREEDLYRRGVIRASCGTIFQLPVTTMTAPELGDFCERNERPIVVASPHASGHIDAVAGDPRRLAIVLGSETTGVRPALDRVAAATARIPTPGPVESLNVSAAAAVLLYTRTRC